MGERENLISALFVRTADLKPSLAIKNHLVLFLRPSWTVSTTLTLYTFLEYYSAASFVYTVK